MISPENILDTPADAEKPGWGTLRFGRIPGQEDVLVVIPDPDQGWIGEHNGEWFSQTILEALPGFRHVIINLNCLTPHAAQHVGSINLILKNLMAVDGEVIIACLHENLVKKFILPGFTEIFHFTDTVEEAVELLTNPVEMERMKKNRAGYLIEMYPEKQGIDIIDSSSAPDRHASDLPDRRISAEKYHLLRSVLQDMDLYLDQLPDREIPEFARSETYELYKHVFETLGISDQTHPVHENDTDSDKVSISGVLQENLKQLLPQLDRLLNRLTQRDLKVCRQRGFLRRWRKVLRKWR